MILGMLCYALEISPNCDLAGGLVKVALSDPFNRFDAS